MHGKLIVGEERIPCIPDHVKETAKHVLQRSKENCKEKWEAKKEGFAVRKASDQIQRL